MRAAVRVLVLLAALAISGCADESPRTNVMLISIDTLRPDHLSAYGYARPTSPAIDGLAAAGVLFEDASATSPWTLPSHASLLTGRYPSRHGATRETRGVASDVPTLAESLAAAGYATRATVNSLYLSDRSGLGRGFTDGYEYLPEKRGETTVNSGAAIVDAAIAWLRDRDERPFFLFLHFYDVHTDYTPGDEYRDLFEREWNPISGLTQQLLLRRQAGEPFSPAEIARLHDLYDAEIRELDDELSRLFAFLDSSGLAPQTLLILTSDHGEEFQEHGGVLHGRTHYQEVISIPLIVRGPGIPAGMRVPEPVSLVDVAPTVLATLGLDPIEGVDGMDLTIHWQHRPAALRERLLVSEADHNNDVPERKRMIRTGDWKLILDVVSEDVELFDLHQDAEERSNLYESEPGRAAAMLAKLRSWLAGGREGRIAPELSEQDRETLESLGYVSGKD